MATGAVKLDDGTGGFAANCFPVRPLFPQSDEAAGAWLVAHRAEQRRRFKAILCTRPKTFSQIREERRKADKEANKSGTKPRQGDDVHGEEEERDSSVLDGFFLLRHCCVEDPADLCSVNIAGQGISDVKEEDFEMFDNVAYVNAAENYLPVEAFSRFPIIRELEMPLNGLRGLKMVPGHFPHLEMLDLSYNNLSQEDILCVGVLQHLKVLQLSGNNFRSLPLDMTLPHRDDTGKCSRFPRLEVLMLDDNKLSDISVFACLAGLRCLRQLNLEKNELFFVPQLTVLDGRVKTSEPEVDSKRHRKSARDGRSSSQNSHGATIQALLDQRLQNTPRVPADVLTLSGQPEQAPENSTVPDAKKPDENMPLQKSEDELLYDEFDTADLSARISDLDLDREIRQASTEDGKEACTSVAAYEEPVGPPPPPFSELRYLNLAHNQICNEEALLAVAAWPMLSELIIHNNPLTDEHPGDPPLLKRFLGDRLGIHLVRKKPQPPGKRHIEIEAKKSRKVKSIVPKIPRVSIEERLMLEAPPTERRSQSCMEKHRTLPPIATPDLRPASTEGSGVKVTDRSEVGDDSTEPISEAWSSEVKDEPTDNPFFMTQIDEQAEVDGKAVARTPTARERRLETLLEDERYKGYEDLLDLEEDPEFDPPKDISGNIRALKYALDHQLVYRDPAPQLDAVKKPVKAYNRTGVKYTCGKTKEEKVDEALTHLRTRRTVEEAQLSRVLGSKRALRRKFPEAEVLLDEIQRRYNMVRVASMSEAKTPRNVVKETLTDVQAKLSDMAHGPKATGTRGAV